MIKKVTQKEITSVMMALNKKVANIYDGYQLGDKVSFTYQSAGVKSNNGGVIIKVGHKLHNPFIKVYNEQFDLVVRVPLTDKSLTVKKVPGSKTIKGRLNHLNYIVKKAK